MIEEKVNNKKIIVSLIENLRPGGETSEEKNHLNQENEERPQYVTMFLAEFIGTGILMFLGCMGCITKVDEGPIVHHLASISFGLVVMLIIQLFGHVSGAHLNPGVTISTVLFKILDIKMAAVYIVAQFLGAATGFGLLKVLAPSEYVSDDFCVTKPHKLTSSTQAFFIELIITAILILICGAVWDKRNAEKQDSVPLRFGLIITAISMCAGPFTGASMNSARSLAPVIFFGNWEYQWIYLISPNIGAVIGFALYKFVFSVKEKTTVQIEEHALTEVNHSNVQKN